MQKCHLQKHPDDLLAGFRGYWFSLGVIGLGSLGFLQKDGGDNLDMQNKAPHAGIRHQEGPLYYDSGIRSPTPCIYGPSGVSGIRSWCFRGTGLISVKSRKGVCGLGSGCWWIHVHNIAIRPDCSSLDTCHVSCASALQVHVGEFPSPDSMISMAIVAAEKVSKKYTGLN